MLTFRALSRRYGGVIVVGGLVFSELNEKGKYYIIFIYSYYIWFTKGEVCENIILNSSFVEENAYVS